MERGAPTAERLTCALNGHPAAMSSRVSQTGMDNGFARRGSKLTFAELPVMALNVLCQSSVDEGPFYNCVMMICSLIY